MLEIECSERNKLAVGQICCVALVSTTHECDVGEVVNEEAKKQTPTWKSLGMDDGESELIEEWAVMMAMSFWYSVGFRLSTRLAMELVWVVPGLGLEVELVSEIRA